MPFLSIGHDHDVVARRKVVIVVRYTRLAREQHSKVVTFFTAKHVLQEESAGSIHVDNFAQSV